MTDTSGDALAASILEEGDAPKKNKLLPLIAVVGVLTLLAIGGGTGLGLLLGGAPPAPEPEAPPVVQSDSAPAAPGPTSVVVKLEPVLTNVSSPTGAMVRLEASVVIDPTKVKSPEVLAGEIQTDTVTFLRTIDLAQIEGARGLLHLREDLGERAKLRSPAVSDYLIQSLVAQ